MDISHLQPNSESVSKKSTSAPRPSEDPALFGKVLDSKTAALVQRGAIRGATELSSLGISSRKVKEISKEDEDEEEKEETVEDTLKKIKKKMRTLIALEQRFLGL